MRDLTLVWTIPKPFEVEPDDISTNVADFTGCPMLWREEVGLKARPSCEQSELDSISTP